MLEGIRVLLVDDDDATRQIVTSILEEAGAVVTAVASAAEALARLEEQSPDVLISDLRMPHVDGYRLIRSIRALPGEVRTIPALALTALATEDVRRQALESGFQKYMAKPATPEALVAAVRDLKDARPYVVAGSEPPSVRYLVIVARDRLDLYGQLSRQFAHDDTVRVIIDRRVDDRRHHEEARSGDRRRSDRRRPTMQVLAKLWLAGYVVVRVE